MTALSAEFFAVRKRPAVKIISLVWAAQILLFGLTIPYAVYLVMSSSTDPETAAAGQATLATVLPDQFVARSLTSFPLFGSAIALVLGAISMGGEFRWNTLGLIMSQRPSRIQIVLSRIVVLSIVVLGLVLTAFAVSALASLVISVIEDRSTTWPSLGAVAAGIGACWLIGTACASVGVFLATVLRSVGSALAVGLIWLFPFEMIINGLAFALPWLKYFQWILITPNAGSLATALGANAPQGAGPVIVSSVTSGPAAALVLLAYVLVFTALTVVIIRRRDIA